MQSFKKALNKQILNPALSKNFSTLIGVVHSYDRVSNKASIEMRSSGKTTILNDIPVMLHGRGIISESLKQGDVVYISCVNDSLFNAKIIGIADDNGDISINEETKKYSNRGEYICDVQKIDQEIKTRVGNRYSEVQYHDTVQSFLNNDYSVTIENAYKNVGTYSNFDVGLINPTSKSIVKLYDDGIIDIFTAGDIGVRINPHSKEIKFFGDSYTNSNNWSVISNNVKIQSDKIQIETKEININSDRITINGDDINV